jgi:hypothetical protein
MSSSVNTDEERSPSTQKMPISRLERLKLKGLLAEFVKQSQTLISVFKSDYQTGETKYKALKHTWTEVSTLITQLMRFIPNEYRSNIERSVESMNSIQNRLDGNFDFASLDIEFSACGLNLLAQIKSAVSEVSGAGTTLFQN